MAKVAAEPRKPSDKGRDALIARLAESMNVVPSKELVDLARTLWAQSTQDWAHKRGSKPDVAKCIVSASKQLADSRSGTTGEAGDR